jgi:iron complex outermembrane receptor protein
MALPLVRMKRVTTGIATLAYLLLPPIVLAQDPDSAMPELSMLDLEDLGRVRITSVSRKSESISRASAAVTVISRDDIRRSGATNLQEALRLVPGMQVARAGTREWAVSARGFNDVTSNKMLVLFDGRAVYSPLYAGVVWAVQRVNMRDIDRIEVIRGPGATLWGSNAVNGVINVITRKVTETPGGEISFSGGTAERYTGAARYAGVLSNGLGLRAYVNGIHESAMETPDGDAIPDGWGIVQGGFRADWSGGTEHEFAFQGDAYSGAGEQHGLVPSLTPPFQSPISGDFTAHGFNLLGRWTHRIAERSSYSLQVYVDRAVTDKPGVYGRAAVNLADLDFQYRLPIGNRHDVLLGLGYRRISDDIEGAFPIVFTPRRRGLNLYTGFLQDDIVLVENRLAVTLGTKFEHNDWTGLEVQPTGRILWTPTLSTTFWAAVSRAVRSPSRVDEDVRSVGAVFDRPPVTVVAGRGSNDFRSERLVAYELGYRATPHQRVAVDIATFYHDYDRLRSFIGLPPESSGGTEVLPFLLTNEGKAQTYGAEASLTYRATPKWRLRFIYSYLHIAAQRRNGAPPATVVDLEPGFNPEHQAGIWSSFDLFSNIELDLSTRYVSPLPGGPIDIPDYISADAKLGFNPGSRFRAGFVGKDLLEARHTEFRFPAYSPEVRAVRRRIFAFVAWVF